MRAARLLFVRPSREASLVPIYAALLALVAVALIAFAVALWPPDREARVGPARDDAAEASATHPVEGGLRLPAGRRDARNPMKSM
jgi:hypothetical protein